MREPRKDQTMTNQIRIESVCWTGISLWEMSLLEPGSLSALRRFDKTGNQLHTWQGMKNYTAGEMFPHYSAEASSKRASK